MSRERYNFDNKERLLSVIGRTDFDNRRFFPLYEKEVVAICRKETSADVFSLIPWNKFPVITQIVNGILERNKLSRISTTRDSGFEQRTSSDISAWKDDIDVKMNQSGTTDDIKSILSKSRNIISRATGTKSLINVCSTLARCNIAGSIPLDMDHYILQYPGSFNPFPHKGHLEMANIASSSSKDHSLLVIATTFLKNKHKKDTENISFPTKIKLMSMAFLDSPNVIVLGIEGDTDLQAQQMQSIAMLGDGQIRYVCGDDAFIKKVKQLQAGDPVITKIFNSNTTFYVSIRKSNQKQNFFEDSKLYVEKLGCDVVLFPEQKTNLSGMKIRDKIRSQELEKSDYPNSYVEECLGNF